MTDLFFKQPPDFLALCRKLRALSTQYPCLKLYPIGKSVLGRDLFALTIGEVHGSTLYVGGTHASEWLTVLLLTRFAQDLGRALYHGEPIARTDAARSLEHRSITIVPCLNPDGVEIAVHGAQGARHLCDFVQRASDGDTPHWKANARGIDLNHNFDAGFEQVKVLERQAGIRQPGPTRFGGSRPHSEPETQALVRFCEMMRPHQAYSFHAQGEEIYYRYGPKTPPRSLLMAQVLACASGYRIATPTGTASHGGFKDWFIDRFARPAFTIEIGRGENPLPVEEFEPIYARLLEMLLISIIL